MVQAGGGKWSPLMWAVRERLSLEQLGGSGEPLRGFVLAPDWQTEGLVRLSSCLG